jgi:hypothetical protein
MVLEVTDLSDHGSTMGRGSDHETHHVTLTEHKLFLMNKLLRKETHIRNFYIAIFTCQVVWGYFG